MPENTEAPAISSGTSPYEAMVQDPASVGGLAAWLDQRGQDLPTFLERAADDFRESRARRPFGSGYLHKRTTFR
ncbi:MAG: hypothetical protein GEU68_12545 [Actinobacteria bacterium]|nr:hypothetical protein [Actinomycetota bacterium]